MMSDDIVTRLRFPPDFGTFADAATMEEAADEIERLRYELAQANNAIKLLIAVETTGENLTAKHMKHYRHCNCLGDADECCDPNCECHQLKENSNG